MLSVSFFQADHSNESRDGKEGLSCPIVELGQFFFILFNQEKIRSLSKVNHGCDKRNINAKSQRYVRKT